MTDINKYKNVSLKRDTYDKLKDLSAMNKTPVSYSGLITYLVDKEWKGSIKKYQIENYPELYETNIFVSGFKRFVNSFTRSSSEH